MLILPIDGTVAEPKRFSHFISCKFQLLPPICDIRKIELAHYITSSQLSILEIDYVYNIRFLKQKVKDYFSILEIFSFCYRKTLYNLYYRREWHIC